MVLLPVIAELTNTSVSPDNLLVKLIITIPCLVNDIPKDDILKYDYSEYFYFTPTIHPYDRLREPLGGVREALWPVRLGKR
jgi:hypothetical protein